MAQSKSKFTTPVDGRSVPAAYLRRVAASHDQRLFLLKRAGKLETITWAEGHARVLGIFHGLRAMSIGLGDKVCIASQSRPEWMLADMAIQAAGAATVPIYHSSTVEDVAFILENSRAKLVFVDDEAQCRKMLNAMEVAKISIPIVTFQDPAPYMPGKNVRAFSEFAVPTNDSRVQAELESSVKELGPQDVSSLVYTSGTTGRPKGAVLTHENFLAELRAITQIIRFSPDDVTVTFLPFAHILGRVESLLPVFAGVTLSFAESINAVASNISEIRPTILVSVPRIYEKIYSKMQSEVESGPEFAKNIFRWAMGIGREVARLRSEEKVIPLKLQAKHRIADRLVFRKIRSKLGGRLRLTVSGGAPLSPELCEIFHACGIRILEGYGLTETTGAVACNRPEAYGFGTVGKPVPGTEVRIAADGEIQLRGPVIFKGYHENPEATSEVLSKDGWFSTGDIGEVTSRGFIKITDRKKELIVTSAGKNIAPQKIENLLKTSRFVSNGMVYGDKQKYLVALITINESEVRHWAKAKGINGVSPEALVEKEEIRGLIDEEIRQINAQLASYETVKRFRILAKDFTVESGELTPSLKLKRKVLIKKYESDISSLYS